MNYRGGKGWDRNAPSPDYNAPSPDYYPAPIKKKAKEPRDKGKRREAIHTPLNILRQTEVLSKDSEIVEWLEGASDSQYEHNVQRRPSSQPADRDTRSLDSATDEYNLNHAREEANYCNTVPLIRPSNALSYSSSCGKGYRPTETSISRRGISQSPLGSRPQFAHDNVTNNCDSTSCLDRGQDGSLSQIETSPSPSSSQDRGKDSIDNDPGTANSTFPVIVIY